MKYSYKWIEAFDLARTGNRMLLDVHISKVYAEVVLPTLKAKCKTIDIADLANEIIAKFWERFYVLEEILPDNVNGYIYTMTINKIFHHQKLSSKLKVFTPELGDLDLQNLLSTEDQDKDASLKSINEDYYSAIEKAILRLCIKCKSIIKLSFFENLKPKDFYKKLAIPSANAASKKKIKCLNKLIEYSYQELELSKSINMENHKEYA